MTFRKVLFALGALFAGNAFAQSSFSIYFNGESPTTNCHVDGVGNAQLSTSGSGNLVATATTPLAFSSACGISGNAQQLTYGPAQPLIGPASTLAAGSNVAGGFSVLPLNAASCTAAIATTSGSGTVTPTSLNVCGFSGKPSCTGTSPIAFNASFTNTGTGPSAYQATVTCLASSGASPASLPSNTVTINQSGNSGGTPVANFTFSANGLAVTFTDTSTDVGGSINAWSWNFGETGSGTNTSTQKNPSHTYAAAGTYTVSLTVTDSVNSAQSTKTLPVTVSAASGNCLTYGSATSGISNYTRWTGNQTADYFGAGSFSVDVTSFNSVFGIGTPEQATWPGNTALTAGFNMPNNKYMSLQFTVPAGFMETVVSGGYGLNTSGYSAPISMTISDGTAPCGDFSNPATNPTSKVVSGCWKNTMTSAGTLAWNGTGGSKCLLQDNHTYYLNMINADISNADPAGTASLTSSKTGSCGGTSCGDPIRNKPILYK